MEFKVIKGISIFEFKKVLNSMVETDFKMKITTGNIKQTHSGQPFVVSISPRDDYIKVITSIESGWPYLQHVIEKNKYTAMSIRYFKDELSEIVYWYRGERKRLLYALRENRWGWCELGEIQSWEDPKNYEARMIKKRLTAEILENYLNKCGFNESIA